MDLQWIYIILYFSAALGIIALVGQHLFRHGAPFLKVLFPHDELHLYLNRLLLIGYYLLNAGYAALNLISDKGFKSAAQVLETWSEQIGLLCLMLGIIHFLNLIWLYLLSKSNITS